MKHEADGLYYVSHSMLRKAGACKPQLKRWERFYGKRKVPLTLAVARRMDAGGYCCGWALDELWVRDKITTSEYFGPFTWDNEVQLMDALAARARREGRLA